MELIPADVRGKLKGLGETDGLGLENIRVPLKLFNPSGAGTWWLWEFDGEDTLFGICELFEREMGYVSLSELESVRCPPFGLRIERDLHWDGKTSAREVMDGGI